jgi:hypothetical protein
MVNNVCVGRLMTTLQLCFGVVASIIYFFSFESSLGIEKKKWSSSLDNCTKCFEA